jgi:para-nitrobenzyl esterase
LSDDVQAYWTNFAKTGNPNGAGVPNWPAFGSAREYLDLGSPAPVAKSSLRAAFCDVWREKLAASLAGQ